MKDPSGPFRYETVAKSLMDQIHAGTLTQGRKAPSLRKSAESHGVSLTTALQAYRNLEDRGYLEARPKSGFYVTIRSSETRLRPARSQPPRLAHPVRVGEDATAILKLGADPQILPLGCAIPSASLLAAGRLDRYLSRAARTMGTRYNTYTEANGLHMLRAEISARAMRWGPAPTPDDTVITCGCTEALSIALAAVTAPGDTVAIESPTYFGLLQVLEARGLKALELPTDPLTGLDVEFLDAAVKQGDVKACLLSSSFNNPLGCSMPSDQKRAVLKILGRYGIPLIEDDIYGDIHFDEQRPPPFQALEPDADILYCSSFSKTIAPGYRIGWVSSRKHVDQLLRAKFAGTLCGPALPQFALAEFLASGGYDNHLRRIRRVFAQNIGHMSRAVDESFPEGTTVTSPKGGFVLWLGLPGEGDTRALLPKAVKERICFAPGSLFSAAGLYTSFMRLSCAHDWTPEIEKGVIRLGQMAQEAVKREC